MSEPAREAEKQRRRRRHRPAINYWALTGLGWTLLAVGIWSVDQP